MHTHVHGCWHRPQACHPRPCTTGSTEPPALNGYDDLPAGLLDGIDHPLDRRMLAEGYRLLYHYDDQLDDDQNRDGTSEL